MFIIVQIPFEDLELYKKYKEEYPGTTLLKGRIEIELFEPSVVPLDISQFPKESKYLFRCYEYGGGKTKTGNAGVICAENGDKLKPVKIFKSGHLSNRKHAKFFVEHPVCVSSTKNGTCFIEEKYFDKVGNKLNAYKDLIWYGIIHELPETFSCYAEAIKAANEKANCYHCRHTHYIIKDEKIG